MEADRIKLYLRQVERAQAKPKNFNCSLVHVENGVLPLAAFTKDVLTFVGAEAYYANRDLARQRVLDELTWLAHEGYFEHVLVDGVRVKGQLCYRPTSKLKWIE